MKKVNYDILRLGLWSICFIAFSCVGMAATLPQLHVDGRYLKNADGEIVNLHGFAQTYSPWFNERGTKWNNYDVAGCLRYNKQKIDEIISAGWKMDFVRLHMDPYWSNTPGVNTEGEGDISAFDFNRFKKYLDEVFVPMAEYAASKGMYVVMRPPGVCPKEISVGGTYHNYLKKVWHHVASHSKLKNNSAVMFELANEPINILGSDGTYGSSSQAHFDKCSQFFQEIVDDMRSLGCNNIIWIPGLAYQSNYSGYAVAPVTGKDIGYAVHAYPGWFGSDAEVPSAELGGVQGGGYDGFIAGWQKQIAPVSDIAPIIVTEMDWAPAKYNSSWGKSITGEAYGEGFGANFKTIVDRSANVSWLLFTEPHLLAQFKDDAGSQGKYTFLNDPQACPWPIYHWYKEYAGGDAEKGEISHLEFREGDAVTMLTGSVYPLTLNAVYADGHKRDVSMLADFVSTSDDVVRSKCAGNLFAVSDGCATVTASYGGHKCSIEATATTFPLVSGIFNPSIWETGSFDERTHTVVTGKYGFAGWNYASGIDMSGYKYCVAVLGSDNDVQVSFRLFDIDNYWTDCSINDFKDKRVIAVNLKELKSDKGRKMDPSHIYIAGFWSLGGRPFVINRVYLTNNDDYLAGIDDIDAANEDEIVDVYTMTGVPVRRQVARSAATDGLPRGFYVVGNEKIAIK